MTERPHLWWRDDDAGRDHARLEALLDLATRRGLPLALAVVPAWLTEPARRRILAARGVVVLQHGWDHADHSAGVGKSIELGGARDVAAVLADLARGHERLADAFGERFVPILVPPWNRIDDRVAAALPTGSYAALSTFGRHRAATQLRHLNTHIDGILWRDERRALDERGWAKGLRSLVDSGTDPVGLLTHHLDMNAMAFTSLDRFLGMLQHASGNHWLAADRWVRGER